MLLNGYPAIYMPNHSRAYTNGMVYVHIIQAEKKLNRSLLKDEVVHHIDHDKTNNSLNNLLIFASQEDHGRFHMTNEKLEYLTLLENGSYICPLEKYNNYLRIHENVSVLFAKKRIVIIIYIVWIVLKNIIHILKIN